MITMRKKLTALFAAFAAAAALTAAPAAAEARREAPAALEAAAPWIPSEDGSVVFYVTRHGKTLFNTVHRAQGWSDTPLTAPGVEVAEQLGRGLAAKGVVFNAAWSSDAGRARQTARLALDNSGNGAVTLNESAAFRESGFGVFEGDTDENMWGSAGVRLGLGATVEEGYTGFMTAIVSGERTIADLLDTLKVIDEGGESPTGMAESYDEVRARMRGQLSALAEEYAAKGGGNVLVVAHGISILTMIDGWTVAPNAGKLTNGQLENAGVTKVVYKNGVFTVTELNNMEYVTLGK